jgi:predicted Fe-S protein YdhL (DUF1289 family)
MSIASPCIRVCTLDEAGELCLGCFRTIEEIGLWSQLTDAARARVVGEAAIRRAGASGQSCEACGAQFTAARTTRRSPAGASRILP